MRRIKRWVRSGLCGLGALLALPIGPAFSAPFESAPISFHIAEQPLETALIQFALQAKVSISHTGLDFGGAIGNAVDGSFPSAEALEQLLAGTGYDFVFLDGQTISIRTKTDIPALRTRLIDELVVTATKRTDIARLLPYSIAVLDGTDLEEHGVQADNDLTGSIAGLNATNLGAGQDKLFIRGLSDSTISGRSQSTVGLYLDDSRVTDDAPDAGLRLVDIDRLEIVRGPQGTLYGAGTLGGLIRIVTNAPDLQSVRSMAALSGAITKDGRPSGSFDGMVNLPLVRNRLAVRAVGYVVRAGGYIDDAGLGRKDINRTDTAGGRLQLLWKPKNNWNVTLGFADQHIEADDTQYVQAGRPLLTRFNLVSEPHKDHFLQAHLTVKGSLPWADVILSSALTRRRIQNRYDASPAWADLTGLSAPTTQLDAAQFDDIRDIQSYTHETRFSSVGNGKWRWVAGLFLSHRDEDYLSSLNGPDTGGALVLARREKRDDHADNVAAFGALTFQLLPKLSATAGARLLYSSLGADSLISQPLSSTESEAEGRNDSSKMNRRFALTYLPKEDITLYASVSEGFRLGGINIDAPVGAINVNAVTTGDDKASVNSFLPDRLWTYEIGAKVSLLNSRMKINAAAWFTDWRNAQSDQILNDSSLYIANVGDVRAPGFEADVAVVPLDGLTLKGNFFWNDPKIVHANPNLIQEDGRMPGVPEMSFGFSARYDLPLKSGFNAFTSVDYAYVGKSHLGFDERTSAVMGDYSQSNFRIGLRRDHWQGALSVTNLANTKANSFAYGNPFLLGSMGQATPLRPLTVGLSLRWTG